MSVSLKQRHPEQAGGFISKHIPSYILELASIESPSHSLLHALCGTAIQSDCVTVTGWDAGHVQLSLCYLIDEKYYCSGSSRQHEPCADGGSGSGTIVLCLACNPVSHHVNPLTPNPIMRCSRFIHLQGHRLYKVLWCVTYA